MQGIVTFRQEHLIELVPFIFDIGSATVFEAYSAYGQDVRCFGTASEHLADIDMNISGNEVFLLYTIHYAEAKGYVQKEKLALDPQKCAGQTWRFSINGWGLIQFQIDRRRAPAIECRAAVNSQTRAEAWASQYPAMKNPSLWNWQLINKRAGQIIRRMKKLAHTGPSPQ